MDINSINKRIDRLLNTIEEEQSSHAMELTPERIEHFNLQCYAFAIEFLKKKGVIDLGYIDHHYNNGKEKWEQYGGRLNEIVDYADEIINNPEKYIYLQPNIHSQEYLDVHIAQGMLSFCGDSLTKYAPSELLDELKNKEILIKKEYGNKLELNEDKLRNLNGTELPPQ